MKLCQRLLFRYGSLQQCPTERISTAKISDNIESHQIKHQLINNMQIAYNCTKIALKYSKCYLCQVSFIRYAIRQMYMIGQNDIILDKVEKLFLNQCPLPKFRSVFKRFDYQNKGIFVALSLIQTDKLSDRQQNTAVQFLTALELVNLGFSLHHSIGKSHRLNLVTRIALKLMSKQMKDSYLVLGGDYFHIKGSVLASQTRYVKLSQILSDVEIDLCKYVHLTEKLKLKIVNQGYDKVNIQQIYNISVLKTIPVVRGMMAMDIITGKDEEYKLRMKEVYEIIGLLMLYRKDLESFMFNFKDILKKYFEYSKNRINFDTQQSLPYYIFFQGAQNKRIDTSYLNTVTMMSQQIEYLHNKLEFLLGKQKAAQVQKKMDYYLMIYS